MAVSNTKQTRIFNTIINLNILSKVSIKQINNKDVFMLHHEQEFVPDFKFVWCTIKEQYRVYIHVASTSYTKTNAGYTICTLDSGLAAAGFCMLYSFLHKYRANSKIDQTVAK